MLTLSPPPPTGLRGSERSPDLGTKLRISRPARRTPAPPASKSRRRPGRPPCPSPKGGGKGRNARGPSDDVSVRRSRHPPRPDRPGPPPRRDCPTQTAAAFDVSGGPAIDPPATRRHRSSSEKRAGAWGRSSSPGAAGRTVTRRCPCGASQPLTPVQSHPRPRPRPRRVPVSPSGSVR